MKSGEDEADLSIRFVTHQNNRASENVFTFSEAHFTSCLDAYVKLKNLCFKLRIVDRFGTDIIRKKLVVLNIPAADKAVIRQMSRSSVTEIHDRVLTGLVQAACIYAVFKIIGSARAVDELDLFFGISDLRYLTFKTLSKPVTAKTLRISAFAP